MLNYTLDMFLKFLIGAVSTFYSFGFTFFWGFSKKPLSSLTRAFPTILDLSLFSAFDLLIESTFSATFSLFFSNLSRGTAFFTLMVLLRSKDPFFSSEFLKSYISLNNTYPNPFPVWVVGSLITLTFKISPQPSKWCLTYSSVILNGRFPTKHVLV